MRAFISSAHKCVTQAVALEPMRLVVLWPPPLCKQSSIMPDTPPSPPAAAPNLNSLAGRTSWSVQQGPPHFSSNTRQQCSSSLPHTEEDNKIKPLDTGLNHFQLLGMCVVWEQGTCTDVTIVIKNTKFMVRTHKGSLSWLLYRPNMQFSLDVKKLEQRYKELQWQFHPDKASLRPAEEQESASEHSTAINNAYSILKNPLARATYMVGPCCVSFAPWFVCRFARAALRLPPADTLDLATGTAACANGHQCGWRGCRYRRQPRAADGGEAQLLRNFLSFYP